jgi:hypothetical protein
VRLHFGDEFRPVRTLAPGLLLILGVVSLGGCVETGGDIAPSADAGQQFVRRDDASMARAPMAIMSVEGAPAELKGEFDQSLNSAAAARQIAVAPPNSARYLVRGYLTASLVQGGSEIDFVWDVFTPNKRRAQRLSDTIAFRGQGDDPWAMVDQAAIDSIAAKCADDLAAYLSNTPEAAPGGTGETGAALSYAQ